MERDSELLVEECRWNIQNSKKLIDLYAKYREKVGTLKIRNLKQMWTLISEEMSLIYHMKINANNCENKWRVLERNYKKYIENKNSTGRGRKYFDFSEEMDQIFAHKKNVHPEILLCSEDFDDSTVHIQGVTSPPPVQSCSTSKCDDDKIDTPSPKKVLKRNSVIKRKISTIEKIRLDRLDYQKKRLEIEHEKLQQLKIRNDLIKARNIILQSQYSPKKKNEEYDFSIHVANENCEANNNMLNSK